MIPASHSPSNAPAAAARVFGAGPLQIHVRAEPGALRDLLVATLSLYDVEWQLTPSRRVDVDVQVVPSTPDGQAAGTYLECAQMRVDDTPAGLFATTLRGARMDGSFGDSEAWHMVVPERLVFEGWWPEIEDLVSLIVTTGWRRAGWVPLHGAGLVRASTGVLVCAMSRVGKTTFALAMARRGWRMVGDDKLLLGTTHGRTVVAAVKHMLNVDPVATTWFPELGELDGLPIYSEWSPKRRVALSSVFPGAPERCMLPTHLIALARAVDPSDQVRVTPLSSAERISALIRQTVIPMEPTIARTVTGAVVGLAQSLAGLRVEVPHAVYANPDALQPLDAYLP